MNLDRPEIKVAQLQGGKYYSIEDAINVYAPGSRWEGDNAKVSAQRENGSTEHYLEASDVLEFLEKNKPELSGFDALLKGVLNVPKPRSE